MGRHVFKLPDVGEGIAEAEISQWHVAVGDRILEDQPMVDMTTDKAIVEIPAPASGTVLSLHGSVGDKVAVGSELVVIETETETKPETKTETKTEAKTETKTEAKTAVAAAPLRDKVLASPAVRQRARQLGIELHQVQGASPDGRVTHADL